MMNCQSVPDWSNENRFFNFESDCYKGEMLIQDSTAAELANMNGVDVEYYVVDVNLKRDIIFKEDVFRNAKRMFKMKMIIPDNLPAMEKTWMSEGSVVNESVKVEINVRHFSIISRNDENGVVKYPSRVPAVGDIIRTVYNGVFWRIVNIPDVTGATQMFGNQQFLTLIMKVLQVGTDSVKPENLTPGMSALDKILNLPDLHDDTKPVENKIEKIAYEPKVGETKKGPSKTDPFSGM